MIRSQILTRSNWAIPRALGSASLLGMILLAGPCFAQDGRLPGYYPTAEEVELLGGQSRGLYRRHSGGTNIGGPDAGSLTASGLWHQDPEPTDSFYERNANFFVPLDNALGFLTPQELLLLEEDEPRRSRLYGYADPGFPFTRDFNPDLASIKLGPLYLDLISLSGTFLYSDYEGTGLAGEDDGFLSSINLDFRGAAQITEHLYLSLSGAVYFLPGDGEVGFYLANGKPTFFRLAYEGDIGEWEYVIFDEFSVHHRLSDIFDEVEHDEIERAGRYRFGRIDNNQGSNFFDSDAIFFINRLGAAANGPLAEDFDAAVSVEHFNSWRTLDFDNPRNWDRLRARVDYNGLEWPVIPFLEYDFTAIDDWDVLNHSIALGARARLTENLRARGRVGYFHSSGGSQDIESPTGELGLIHNLGPSTSHSLFGGVTQRIWEDGENLLASYARYSVAHRFGSRLRASAFAQYSDLENLDGTTVDRHGWSLGANLTAYISEYTRGDLGVNYDTWDGDKPAPFDQDRFILRAALSQQILPYLHGRLLYQFEDYDSSGPTGFNEHLYMLTLTHPF